MKKTKFILLIVCLSIFNWKCICWNFSAGTFNHFATYEYNCSKEDGIIAINELYIQYPKFKPKEKREPPKSFDSVYSNLLNWRYADTNYYCFNLQEKKLRFEISTGHTRILNDSIFSFELAAYATLGNNMKVYYYICNNNPSNHEIRQMIKIFEIEILTKLDSLLALQTKKNIIRLKK